MSRGETQGVVGFLQYVSDMLDDFGWQKSRSDSRALIGGEHAITVSTWHRSKGLEWPVTILYGLESIRDPSPYGVNVMTGAKDFDVANPLAQRWIRYWPNVYSVKSQIGPVREAMEATTTFAALTEKSDREAMRVLYVGWTRARDRLIFAVQQKKFTKGLLGKLEAIDASLIEEPEDGDTTISWGGQSAPIEVLVLTEVEPVVRTPVAGTVTLPRKKQEYADARLSPSSAKSIPCKIAEQADLGPRLAIKANSDMEFVGNAVHGFLAADHKSYSAEQRLELAEELLRRCDIEGCLSGDDVVTAADRLWSWIEKQFPDAQLFREWPVQHKLEPGTVVAGTADLLVKTAEGFVVIDHKTFPGTQEMALDRARSYSGQLQAYSDAVAAATGEPVQSMWIHFPVLGLMAEVVATPGK